MEDRRNNVNPLQSAKLFLNMENSDDHLKKLICRSLLLKQINVMELRNQHLIHRLLKLMINSDKRSELFGYYNALLSRYFTLVMHGQMMSKKYKEHFLSEHRADLKMIYGPNLTVDVMEQKFLEKSRECKVKLKLLSDDSTDVLKNHTNSFDRSGKEDGMAKHRLPTNQLNTNQSNIVSSHIVLDEPIMNPKQHPSTSTSKDESQDEATSNTVNRLNQSTGSDMELCCSDMEEDSKESGDVRCASPTSLLDDFLEKEFGSKEAEEFYDSLSIDGYENDIALIEKQRVSRSDEGVNQSNEGVVQSNGELIQSNEGASYTQSNEREDIARAVVRDDVEDVTPCSSQEIRLSKVVSCNDPIMIIHDTEDVSDDGEVLQKVSNAQSNSGISPPGSHDGVRKNNDGARDARSSSKESGEIGRSDDEFTTPEKPLRKRRLVRRRSIHVEKKSYATSSEDSSIDIPRKKDNLNKSNKGRRDEELIVIDSDDEPIYTTLGTDATNPVTAKSKQLGVNCYKIKFLNSSGMTPASEGQKMSVSENQSDVGYENGQIINSADAVQIIESGEGAGYPQSSAYPEIENNEHAYSQRACVSSDSMIGETVREPALPPQLTEPVSENDEYGDEYASYSDHENDVGFGRTYTNQINIVKTVILKNHCEIEFSPDFKIDTFWKNFGYHCTSVLKKRDADFKTLIYKLCSYFKKPESKPLVQAIHGCRITPRELAQKPKEFYDVNRNKKNDLSMYSHLEEEVLNTYPCRHCTTYHTNKNSCRRND